MLITFFNILCVLTQNNLHSFFITYKSHRYMTWTLNLDSLLGRVIEYFNIFLLNAKRNTLLHFKRFRRTPKKVAPLLSILDQNIGIGLRYGLDNPIT